MTVGQLTALVDEMLLSAHEANRDFDILAFEQEAFPCGGDCIGSDLAAHLDFLREKLDELATDLRTLPLVSA